MPQSEKGADRHPDAGIGRARRSERQFPYGNPAIGSRKTSADGCTGHALAHLFENRCVPLNRLLQIQSRSDNQMFSIDFFSSSFLFHLHFHPFFFLLCRLAAGNQHRPTPVTSSPSDFIQRPESASLSFADHHQTASAEQNYVMSTTSSNYGPIYDCR